MSRYRYEYKHMIDARQEGILMVKTRSLMQPDVHAGTDGRYMVRSLYLDDPEKSCAGKTRRERIPDRSSGFDTITGIYV